MKVAKTFLESQGLELMIGVKIVDLKPDGKPTDFAGGDSTPEERKIASRLREIKPEFVQELVGLLATMSTWHTREASEYTDYAGIRVLLPLVIPSEAGSDEVLNRGRAQIILLVQARLRAGGGMPSDLRSFLDRQKSNNQRFLQYCEILAQTIVPKIIPESLVEEIRAKQRQGKFMCLELTIRDMLKLSPKSPSAPAPAPSLA